MALPSVKGAARRHARDSTVSDLRAGAAAEADLDVGRRRPGAAPAGAAVVGGRPRGAAALDRPVAALAHGRAGALGEISAQIVDAPGAAAAREGAGRGDLARCRLCILR